MRKTYNQQEPYGLNPIWFILIMITIIALCLTACASKRPSLDSPRTAIEMDGGPYTSNMNSTVEIFEDCFEDCLLQCECITRHAKIIAAQYYSLDSLNPAVIKIYCGGVLASIVTIPYKYDSRFVKQGHP
jgi:hypothetical protein